MDHMREGQEEGKDADSPAPLARRSAVEVDLDGALAASFYSLRVVRVGIARHVHVAAMAPRATPSTRCPTQSSTKDRRA